MKQPSVAECLIEIARARAENKRLRDHIAEARPSAAQVIEIATALRDLAFEFEMKANYFGELRDKAYAIVGKHALPSSAEVGGINSGGRQRVDGALESLQAVAAVDPVDG